MDEVEKKSVAEGIKAILIQDRISAANYAHSLNVPPMAIYGLLNNPLSDAIIPKRLQTALGITHVTGTKYKVEG
jgi:hypothetical protein